MADRKNIVASPPLTTSVVDDNGMMSRAWAIFFRDLFARTSYKGGNSIDDTATLLDGTITTLDETIVQVLINVTAISENTAAIISNAENLTTHEDLEEAHGSNGDIVGLNDLANETTQGLVKRMALIGDAVASTVNIVTADIAAAPATYNQAYTDTVKVLTNENKDAINQLASDLNNAITVLNSLLSNSQTAGQMTGP